MVQQEEKILYAQRQEKERLYEKELQGSMQSIVWY